MIQSALLVNGSDEPQCGVNQFGKNLHIILKDSQRIRWHYHEASDIESLRSAVSTLNPEWVIYNWQAGQGGILTGAPFPWAGKQCLVYHDLEIREDDWDAIFFADPTIASYRKWHVIGRPLPKFDGQWFKQLQDAKRPVVGVHGFLGAWADQVVWRVMQEFEYGTVRMCLPFARYGDRDGAMAKSMADRCQKMVEGSGVELHISHDFLSPEELTSWLAVNDMNCYIRPPDMNWRGISSAPDFALAANRPIAVNKCNAFRHLHNLSPSICIEDSSLTDIFANGLEPFINFKNKWCDPQVIRDQVEEVLERI